MLKHLIVLLALWPVAVYANWRMKHELATH